MKEKEQKIMDASLKLFVEKGFHGTSTAEIARTAGVATGTLFHYFKTKEELINRLFLYTKESMFSQMKEHFEVDKSLKENLKNLWSKFIYFSIRNPYKFQFILIFHTSPYITSLTKEQLEPQLDVLLSVYEKGILDQELKEAPFELMIEYFWGNIISTINYFNKYPEKLGDKNMDQAFELLWDGVSR